MDHYAYTHTYIHHCLSIKPFWHFSDISKIKQNYDQHACSHDHSLIHEWERRRPIYASTHTHTYIHVCVTVTYIYACICIRKFIATCDLKNQKVSHFKESKKNNKKRENRRKKMGNRKRVKASKKRI